MHLKALGILEISKEYPAGTQRNSVVAVKMLTFIISTTVFCLQLDGLPL